MSETKQHTAGPWNFLETFGRVETEQHVIAYIAGGVGSPHFNLDHAKENGRLIAAAPELLESLKEFVGLANFDTDTIPKTTEEWDAMVAKAEAVISKAEGR